MRAVVLLPLLTVSLRLRGFGATRRFLQKFVNPGKSGLPVTAAESYAALTSRMVVAAARSSPIPSTCLERSLSLWWLLARQGITTQFRIGVRKDGDKFAAHAWVERDGVALGELQAQHLHYAAFAEEMSGEAS